MRCFVQDDAQYAAQIQEREGQVAQALSAKNSQQAVQAALMNPPYGTKNSDIKVPYFASPSAVID